MWPLRRKKHSPVLPPDQPVRLSCILHFLARRNETDEGFIITSSCLSTCQFEYQTRGLVHPGETLQLKIVSGSYSIDVRCTVLTTSDRPGQAPLMEFKDLTDLQQRVIRNLMQRYGSQSAS